MIDDSCIQSSTIMTFFVFTVLAYDFYRTIHSFRACHGTYINVNSSNTTFAVLRQSDRACDNRPTMFQTPQVSLRNVHTKACLQQCRIVNSHRSTHGALTISKVGIMYPRHQIRSPYIHPLHTTLQHHTQLTSHNQNHVAKYHDDHNRPRPRSPDAHPSAPTHLPHPAARKLHLSDPHPLQVKHNIALPAQHRRA